MTAPLAGPENGGGAAGGPPAHPIDVMIVEDQREIREGLARLIDRAAGFRCIERLDRRLLIGREHGRVLRRIPYNLMTSAALTLSRIGLHVPPEPMRLQPGPSPRHRHVVVIYLQEPSELARAPVRAAPGGACRVFSNVRFHRWL
jgi:hypothetical protein